MKYLPAVPTIIYYIICLLFGIFMPKFDNPLNLVVYIVTAIGFGLTIKYLLEELIKHLNDKP